MPRPVCPRRVGQLPQYSIFKPAGAPAGRLETVEMRVDEYEAMRLADLEGLYQEQVAEKMGISRQTVGNLLTSARMKVADALVNSKMLQIEGGVYVTGGTRQFLCRGCGNPWSAGLGGGGGRPEGCPKCGSKDIRRDDAGRLCVGGKSKAKRRCFRRQSDKGENDANCGNVQRSDT